MLSYADEQRAAGFIQQHIDAHQARLAAETVENPMYGFIYRVEPVDRDHHYGYGISCDNRELWTKTEAEAAVKAMRQEIITSNYPGRGILIKKIAKMSGNRDVVTHSLVIPVSF